jgi:hypothetical protein
VFLEQRARDVPRPSEVRALEPSAFERRHAAEIGPAQIGAAQVCVAEVDLVQFRSHERGIAEIRFVERRTGEQSFTEIGADELRSRELGAHERCDDEARSGEIGASKVAITEIGAGKVGTSEVRGAEPRSLEIRGSPLGFRKAWAKTELSIRAPLVPRLRASNQDLAVLWIRSGIVPRGLVHEGFLALVVESAIAPHGACREPRPSYIGRARPGSSMERRTGRVAAAIEAFGKPVSQVR